MMTSEDLEIPRSIFIDLDIERLAREQGLIVPFDPNLLSGCSYDLRVGAKLTSRNRLSSFELTKAGYVVESGECVTVDTLETIDLRNISAFGVIANKHSLAVTGLFHPITTIDPGFRGPLALTFFNMGNVRYVIRPGDRIAKVFFEPLAAVPQRIYGVTQRPSHREGATMIASIVDHPQHRDDDEELSKMYGAPVRKLYEYLRELGRNVELFDLRRRQGRRDRWVGWIVAAITGAGGALLTNIIRENWQSIASFYNHLVH